ncbi:putative mitochondrial protein [Cucumis melo var. makuwa]|uniref:Mitochondrial protein n=1 Tax=Cucumis melo var. makuwa TaxID=1194695 RepID=A0A5A7VGG2_CUCMM|nr:putative mitochondrial protein [Cucumis melo var. makuwa]TYK28006.1 putative mitochondrial protein [Cucumis melo var. makuwa]
MSQERGLKPYCWRDASRAGLNEMRPFGEAKSISGHQTLQLMRRPYGLKGSVYVVTLSTFQRCLEDGPDAAEQGPGSKFPTGRRTEDSHLEAYHDLQARPARPGRASQLGVRGSIVPADPLTEYSSFSKAGRDLFSATKKKGADLTRHNLTMHPIPLCLECLARSLLLKPI